MNASVTTARRVVAAIMALQGLGMTVFALLGFLAWTSKGSASDDGMRVLTESLLVLLFAAGSFVLARLWLGASDWPRTPTIVWHVLLMPVAYSLWASGQPLICAALSLVIIAVIVSALRGSAEAPSPSAEA